MSLAELKQQPQLSHKRLNSQRRSVATELITPDPSQPRTNFDETYLLRLGNSMRSEGQMQDILVRPNDSGGYTLIAGECRWRAATMVGLAEVNCQVVEDVLSKQAILRLQIIENALREDLKPCELGKAFKAAMEIEGLTGKELAAKLHIHPSTVSRTLKLVSLPEETQSKVDSGALPMMAAINPSSPSKKKTKKPIRFRCDKGIRVTITSPRKSIAEEEIVAALNEALSHVATAPKPR